ncbi:MAG: hypothetical protein LBN03_00970 [Bifidobacteriaceae bacterium]|jgi:hypothetical protein|nr:hypothetical protein [Bifidobacteriaceae bacterium]
MKEYIKENSKVIILISAIIVMSITAIGITIYLNHKMLMAAQEEIAIAQKEADDAKARALAAEEAAKKASDNGYTDSSTGSDDPLAGLLDGFGDFGSLGDLNYNSLIDQAKDFAKGLSENGTLPVSPDQIDDAAGQVQDMIPQVQSQFDNVTGMDLGPDGKPIIYVKDINNIDSKLQEYANSLGATFKQG